MRLIAAFFMVMLLLLPILLRLGLLGHYQLNKAKITRLHCINRDKPAMHCEGKCYLQAQLEKAQREQESMEGVFAGWDKAEDWLPPSLLGCCLHHRRDWDEACRSRTCLHPALAFCLRCSDRHRWAWKLGNSQFSKFPSQAILEQNQIS